MSKPQRKRRNQGFASRLLIGISSAVCILLFQNCGADFVAMDEEQLAAMGKFTCSSNVEKSFSKTYGAFARANCAGCHTTVTPKFAIADASVAYGEFAKTTTIKFLEYGTNPNHGSGAGKPEHADAISVVQEQFDECRGITSGPATDTVTARTAPFTLNATANLTLKTINPLDTNLELGGTNLSGARLHFQVQYLANLATPSYVIARPSLQTGAATVAVKSITLRVNGIKISTATAFKTVNAVINPNTNPIANNTPNGNLWPASTTFPFPGANPATDKIQFEFELLQAQ